MHKCLTTRNLVSGEDTATCNVHWYLLDVLFLINIKYTIFDVGCYCVYVCVRCMCLANVNARCRLLCERNYDVCLQNKAHAENQAKFKRI